MLGLTSTGSTFYTSIVGGTEVPYELNLRGLRYSAPVALFSAILSAILSRALYSMLLVSNALR